jgi:hypothetical protein
MRIRSPTQGCSLCDVPRLRVHLTVPLLATSSLLTSPTLLHTGLPVSPPPSLLTWAQHSSNVFDIVTAKNQYRKLETNIPRKGIAWPQPQLPHSCVCERFIYIYYRSALLLQEIRGPILVSDSYPAFFLPIATTSNKNF